MMAVTILTSDDKKELENKILEIKEKVEDSGQNLNLDTTLTKSGEAADAKATGDEIKRVVGLIPSIEGLAKTEEIPTKPEDIGAQPKGNYAIPDDIPKVPSWAMQASKPGYTASEVGADPQGAAASAVNAHNANTDAHTDLRLEIRAIREQLAAFLDVDDETLNELSELIARIVANQTSIAQLTTGKVNVADIIDNLTTNVANKPLSAAQGVVIKTLIDGLSTGKLDASALQSSIDTALAQAKASGEFDGAKGDPGRGIKSIARTSGNGAAGTTDTYTITYTDDTTSTFTVRNGSNGAPGTAATFEITGVTALAYGAAPTVTEASGSTATDRKYVVGIPAGKPGKDGSDATVTAKSIEEALGYVPVGAGTDSPLTGKKIVYDGDSICAAAFGYPKLIADKTACIFENQAVGGARLCAVSDKHSVVNNLANLPTDGDIYCFEGGINDWWANTPVGTFAQGDYTGAVDATTIYGAMETICRYALTNFFGKAICFVIVHKVQNSAYSQNTAGHTFWDYRKAMIEVCEKYSIPYYDAFAKSGLNGWNAAQKAGLFVSGDGTHPNEAAYEAYYVPQLISLFESIVPVGDYEAPAKPVTYTNVLKTAVGTDGQPYNGGKGWKENTYLSYDGRTESSSTNYDVTGWIPARIGDVVRLKNVQLCKTVGTSSKCIVATVKSDFSALASTAWLKDPSEFSDAWQIVTNDAGTDVIQFTVPTSLLTSLAYIRLCCGTLTDASVITINEEID